MPQGFAAFYVLGIDRNAGHRADLHALGFVKMPHAFGAFAGVDLIDLFTQIDGLVGALGFADIAVDAKLVDLQRHVAYCNPVCGETRVALGLSSLAIGVGTPIISGISM